MLFQMRKIVSVRVPESIRHRDDAHTSLHESSRDQQLIIPCWRTVTKMFGGTASVAFQHMLVFTLYIHRIDQSRGCQHIERPSITFVHFVNAASVRLTTKSIQLF